MSRSTAVLLAMVAIALVAFLGQPAAAVAAPLPPSIQGTVLDSQTGTGAAGITVNSWRWNAALGDYSIEATVQTGADGTYRIYSLSDRDHYVSFRDKSGSYVPQWYQDAAELSSATGVPTLYGLTSGGIDAALTPYSSLATGSIAGVIRGSGGTGIQGAQVQLHWWDPIMRTWAASSTTASGADGTYVFASVKPGSWRIAAGDNGLNYRTGYFDGASDLGSAATLVVSPGSAHVADISLGAWPSISGMVTDAASGTPLAGIQVTAYELVGSEYQVYDFTTTADDGTWGLYALPPNAYLVEFFDPLGLYAPSWWSGKGDINSADLVLAGEYTHVSGISAGLEQQGGAAISGTVTDRYTGSPLAGAAVALYDAAGSGDAPLATATADEVGRFVFSDLPPGIYRVGATDAAYTPGFFDSAGSFGAASDLTVTDSRTRITNVDLDLAHALPPALFSDVKGSYADTATVHMWATDSGDGVTSLSYRLDGAATVTVAGDSADAVAFGAGSHQLRFTATDPAGNTSAPKTLAFKINVTRARRISGASRFDVSAHIANAQGSPSGRDVVLASGDDAAAADPLSAAGLSWAYGSAPLLLTSRTSLPGSVASGVGNIANQLSGDTTLAVHIVGGTGSVPDVRFTDLVSGVRARYGSAAANRLVKDRILATGNRYALAAAVAHRMQAVRGSEMATFALVANGADSGTFFDALALSPIAARCGAPILLVSKNAVPAPTAAALASLGATGGAVWIAGGTGTVAESVRTQLGVPSAHRLAGANRYKTAVVVANTALARGWLTDAQAGVAAKLPDALTGGTYLGWQGGPLLVTTPSPLQKDTSAWISAHRASLADVWVFGGTGSVSQGTANQIDALFN